MGIKTGKKALFTEINITPLTDIFLVLLIIMMVIAPLLDQQGLNLTVPEMVSQEQIKDNNSKILSITVTSDDKYYIDGKEIADTDLEKTLKSLAKDYPDGLMIETDGNSSHGAVVKLMDNARNSGITSISISEF